MVHRAVSLVVLLTAYIAAAKFGLSLASVNPSASPVWPPTGIAIAGALLLGRAAWPVIFLGAFLVNVTTAGSTGTSLAIALGNTIEAVAGARLLEGWAAGRRMLARTSTVFRFTAVMPVATALSPTIGVTSLAIAGYASWSGYVPVFVTWWLGDLTGALIVVPVLLAWLQPAPISRPPIRGMEVVALYLVNIAAAMLVFDSAGPWAVNLSLAFLTTPGLVWAALRFGQRETTVAIALVSAIATWGTVRAYGPFAIAAPNTGLLVLQAFLATSSTMVLAMAAVVIERRRVEVERVRLLRAEQAAHAQADAASAAKDEFLALLGHELRNPLAAITTAAYVLALPDAREDAGARAQAIIARQAAHLSRLVDDLLDVARIRTGKITLDRHAVDLAALVAQVTDALRLKDDGRGPAIQFHPPEDGPVWVDGDATRLEQVVTNLAGNAIKFTPAPGRVELRVSRQPSQAVLEVEDTGIGIASEILPHIFDRFIQAGTDSGGIRSGLGLGLTLVKHLVVLHGGSVTARSDGAGRGSVFVVRLPLASRADRVVDVAAPPVEARRRVLVVEDQHELRQMMRVALEHAGHEIVEAGDGPSAVRAAVEHLPDVAFVDIGLPGFDGYEVARQLRAARGRAIGLVAVTGYGQAADRARAEAAGFDRHLVKPVTPPQLSEVLRAFDRKD